MSDSQRHTKTGPTPAEERMLRAYDTFFTLLTSRPKEARTMAYEVEAVAEKYIPKSTGERK